MCAPQAQHAYEPASQNAHRRGPQLFDRVALRKLHCASDSLCATSAAPLLAGWCCWLTGFDSFERRLQLFVFSVVHMVFTGFTDLAHERSTASKNGAKE